VLYPPPCSPFQFFLNWGLVGLLPELFVGNLLRPSDVEAAPETVVNERESVEEPGRPRNTWGRDCIAEMEI
jgi:hypothetical protein